MFWPFSFVNSKSSWRRFLTVSFQESITYPLICQPGTRWVYGVGLDWVCQLVSALITPVSTILQMLGQSWY